MIACQRLLDLKVIEQPQSIARVLRRDQVNFLQSAQNALCDIAQISDRCGAEIESSAAGCRSAASDRFMATEYTIRTGIRTAYAIRPETATAPADCLRPGS